MITRREFLVISPIFPSGIAWVLNTFLELGVQIYRGQAKDFWRKGLHGYTLAKSEDDLKQSLPSLNSNKEFSFEYPLAVRWAHEWPSARSLRRPVILFVRNGKAALYSYYKRMESKGTFLDFLRKPFTTGANDFDSRLGLPPAETWALFSLLWWRLYSRSGLLMRFEDSKANPFSAISAVLNYLAISADGPHISRALEMSTFERAKAHEEQYLEGRRMDISFRVNRRGEVDEWTEAFGDDENDCFMGLPDLALSELGYFANGNIPSVPISPLEEEKRSLTDWYGRAAEMLHEQEPLTALSRLAGIAQRFSGEAQDALELGKVLTCFRWTGELYGKQNLTSTIAQHTLIVLLQLAPCIKDRPLIVAQAAHSLALAGNRTIAMTLLDNEVQLGGHNHYELLKLSDTLEQIDAIAAARRLLRDAARKPIPTDERAQLAKRLLVRRMPLSAWRALKSSGRRIWFKLVQHEMPRICKRSARPLWMTVRNMMAILSEVYKKARSGLQEISIDNSHCYHYRCPLCGSEKMVKQGVIRYPRLATFADIPIKMTRKPELWKCDACMSGFTQYCMSEREVVTLYRAKTSEKWTLKTTFEEFHPLELVEYITDQLTPGKHVLDIGCGQGDFLDFTARLGCIPVGVELSDRDRAICERKGYPCVASLEALHANARFDFIFAFDLVEHIHNLTEFLNRCSVFLCDGGKLAIQTGNIGCSSAANRRNHWWYVRYPEHIVFPSITYFSTLDRLTPTACLEIPWSSSHNGEWGGRNATLTNYTDAGQGQSRQKQMKDHVFVVLEKTKEHEQHISFHTQQFIHQYPSSATADFSTGLKPA